MDRSHFSKSGIGALAYGILSYGLFLGVFLYAIGFIGGFLTPTRLDGPASRPLWQALAIDLGLLGLFAVQHSVMARQGFKRWLTRFVPEPVVELPEGLARQIKVRSGEKSSSTALSMRRMVSRSRPLPAP